MFGPTSFLGCLIFCSSTGLQITDHDIRLFAEVSTDRNPVHLDEDYARETTFEGRIAHGMLTAALVSVSVSFLESSVSAANTGARRSR